MSIRGISKEALHSGILQVRKLLEGYKDSHTEPKMRLTAEDELMLVISFPDEIIIINEEMLLSCIDEGTLDRELIPKAIVC